MLNANKSFVLKEQNDTKSFENLSDVNEYISNKYPLKRGYLRGYELAGVIR